MANQFTIYRSTDSGATSLTGQTGSLVSVLDACLVNGWTASVVSINRSGTTATVVTSGAHGLNTGNSTTIAGANETDYNITAQVTVLSSTSFTYEVANSPATPATGTITWAKLAAGWAKAFSGTSKAAYRAASGTRLYLRVQDDGPGGATFKEARITGYETMSDVDTGTNPFPTAAQGVGSVAMVVVRKSATTDSAARAWIVVADARTIYMFVQTGDTAGVYLSWGFGEIYSVHSGDTYNCQIVGRSAENNSVATIDKLDVLSNLVTAVSASFFARSYTGSGASITFGKHGDGVKGSASALLGATQYPNPEDNLAYFSPVWVTETGASVRGWMRGFYHFLHAISNVNDGDTVNGTGQLSGKTLLFIKTSGNNGVYVIETSATLDTN